MSLPYKDTKDVEYKLKVTELKNGKLELCFSADCGKFGTDEILDIHELTPFELLTILQSK